MLHLVHTVTISIKPQLVKLGQAVSENFTSQRCNMSSTYSLDPVPSSIRARNVQGINITNRDVTTWSWVNLVNPSTVNMSNLFFAS